MTQVFYEAPLLAFANKISHSKRRNARKNQRHRLFQAEMTLQFHVEIDDGVCVGCRVQNVLQEHHLVGEKDFVALSQGHHLEDLLLLVKLGW